MTGNSGGKCMIILTTCNASALDEAVLDRCDEVIYPGPLSLEQRKMILQQELHKHFDTSHKNGRSMKGFTRFIYKKKQLYFESTLNKSEALQNLSKMSEGLSGRELSKIVRAVENAVYASDNCLLNGVMWDKVTREMFMSMKAKANLKHL